jgi:hypothetical protein
MDFLEYDACSCLSSHCQVSGNKQKKMGTGSSYNPSQDPKKNPVNKAHAPQKEEVSKSVVNTADYNDQFIALKIEEKVPLNFI